MAFGKTEYNEYGEPKCEICGLFFNRVITHARQKHNIDKKQYKKQFGLDFKKGICSKASSEKTRNKTLSNYDKCVSKNLLEKGSNTRFVKREKYKKSYVSEQTKIMLREKLKNPAMIEAMKKDVLNKNY